MFMYVISFIFLCIGIFAPPMGGYEMIFLVVGGYMFFKKLREKYE